MVLSPTNKPSVPKHSLVCSNSAASASNNGGLLFPLDNNNNNNNNDDEEANNKQKWGGFGFLKQERAISNANEGDDFRSVKMAKIASLQRSNGCDSSDGHQQMLSFSSPTSQAMAFPYYHQTSSAFGRNTGYGSSGINGANMQQGVLSGVRGPFTPSQWMELEHQALIYKYITANVPIPSYLLTPIRKAFECAGFPSFPGLRSNALGWGAFHLGFASTDPEPGRCRRTDGKKWRCSRDAVADQKYCERHMNRGRHRSRKPVEGQSGHCASGPTTTTSGKAAALPAASASVVVPAGSASSSTIVLSHRQQLGSSNNHHHPSGIPNINRSVADKENNQFSTTKHHPYGESEFGLVCSDSLLNPLNKSSSLVNLKSYGTSDNNLNDHEHKSSHPLRQFMDDWPKNRSDDTQLSISITSDFMSSSSSPTNEKTTASPPRLSRELEMGLGLGPGQANWVPISWEPSMGGPLGEVLHTTTNASECKTTKPLNLIDTWDSSPRMASSPTGVLQRGAFGSLSNSSAGSSPGRKRAFATGSLS